MAKGYWLSTGSIKDGEGMQPYLKALKDWLPSVNGELNLTKKQKWIPLNCVFEEKFNKLLNEKNYKCPICGEYLKQSSL